MSCVLDQCRSLHLPLTWPGPLVSVGRAAVLGLSGGTCECPAWAVDGECGLVPQSTGLGCLPVSSPWALSLLLVPLIPSCFPHRWSLRGPWDQQVPEEDRGFQGYWSSQSQAGILPVPAGPGGEAAAGHLGGRTGAGSRGFP